MSYKINFGYEIMRPNKGGFFYEKRNYMVTDNGFYHSFYSAQCKGNKWPLPKIDFKPITPFTPSYPKYCLTENNIQSDDEDSDEEDSSQQLELLNQTYNRKKKLLSPKDLSLLKKIKYY